jgi:hypothetical protein
MYSTGNLRTFEEFDMNDLKSFARKDINNLDYKYINKIALFALNIHKKYRCFSIYQPYRRWPVMKDVYKIQFVIDKGCQYEAIFQHFTDGNDKLVLQIVCRKNDLELLGHEIQHALEFLTNPKSKERYSSVVADMLAQADERQLSILYFLQSLYFMIDDESESYLSQTYHRLLKKKTNRNNFYENLKDNEIYNECKYFVNNEWGYINNIKKNPKQRVHFFSQLKEFLANLDDLDKMKIKKLNFFQKLDELPLIGRFFSGRIGHTIKYKEKISQEEADELAKFWIGFMEDKAKLFLTKIDLMKYLFKDK